MSNRLLLVYVITMAVTLSEEAKWSGLKRRHLDRDDTNFEKGRMGIWSNVKGGDDFDWTFKKGFTKTMNTGPMHDHTTGKGYYLYIESSTPRKPGDKAKLESEWMPHVPGDGQCIKFAYSMYGATIGSLSLTIEYKGSNVKPYDIFDKKGNQGKGWKIGKGNIHSLPAVPYRLTFTATIGKGTGYSDIAIDDVVIDPGLCVCTDSNPYQCGIWASKGECEANPKFMLKKCKKSCSQCHKYRCHDDHARCIEWADLGECEKNPKYMMEKCKKSCRSCRYN